MPTEESPQQNGPKQPQKMEESTNDSIMHTTFLDGDIISIESASRKAREVIYLFRYFLILSQITSCTDILCHFYQSEMKGSGFALRTLTTPKCKAQSTSNLSITSATHE